MLKGRRRHTSLKFLPPETEAELFFEFIIIQSPLTHILTVADPGLLTLVIPVARLSSTVRKPPLLLSSRSVQYSHEAKNQDLNKL